MAKEVVLTKEGYEEIKARLDLLTTERRREIAAAIKEAREFGDLSENAEYDAAKNEQAVLEDEIASLEEQLRVERSNEEAECTFKPHMSTKKKAFSYVQHKYDKPIPVNRSLLDDSAATEGCTFTPKVRGVGRSMSAAKLYVR